MFWKKAGVAAGLSLYFLLVYGLCNWITSLRHGVGTFRFAWERHIPFVPLMILPYMSIDLFFVAAPWFCAGRADLRTLGWRILAAITFAGLFFLLFPFRVGFVAPQVHGFLGLIFNKFRGMDKPYNEFPSLHIALLFILADLYLRRFAGAARAILAGWFALIGLSAVLTYQHQVMDVAGGAILGVFCLHLIQNRPLSRSTTGNWRVFAYYFCGAAVCMALAVAWRPWSLLLFYPAASLALVAAGYAGFGAGIFRKRRGRLPWTTWATLWPVLLAQRLSLRYYALQSDAWSVLPGGLYFGRKLTRAEARQAVAAGVVAVVDLCGEFAEPRALRDIAYQQMRVLDLTAPTLRQQQRAVHFIECQLKRGGVLVHCKAGYSRTAAIAGAYLLHSGRVTTAADALAMLQAARPRIVVRPEARRAIQRYEIENGRQPGAKRSAQQNSNAVIGGAAGRGP